MQSIAADVFLSALRGFVLKNLHPNILTSLRHAPKSDKFKGTTRRLDCDSDLIFRTGAKYDA